ncbi:MAG: Tol-Pal system protein TolB, partial [Pseudomonadota bacterium]|nr:Tol-Pal system protein TolB [Pseudomonadota bacterium]
MKTYLARLALIGLTFCGAVLALNGSALAQNGPLRIEIDQGVIEPLPYAVPDFIPDDPA